MSEHEQGWTPDKVQKPEYPPPEVPGIRAGDLERATHPTAWQKLQAERAAEQSQQSERPVWPGGLTDEAKTELLRCADAFEATAARLRRIVE